MGSSSSGRKRKSSSSSSSGRRESRTPDLSNRVYTVRQGPNFKYAMSVMKVWPLEVKVGEALRPMGRELTRMVQFLDAVLDLMQKPLSRFD
ncbi:hypothetical protein CBR_g34331 [Chara braunii]|uniref:Uncharacterized protein n=1 Tax=Chara braunii TaxID=69332 RepID=A0A388LIL7_CHABU|nr:hypothetical protein CBR_g34331 [Chara braunii]|eukprot:GBG82052.1 hypothetical protein CBR_g34331 [Chara braunii]